MQVRLLGCISSSCKETLLSRPRVVCRTCAARRAQLRKASTAGVMARRAEASAVREALTEKLKPMFCRDPHLSARAAAHRLVERGAIGPELLDRARRLAGGLRKQLAATVGHRQCGGDTVLGRAVR